MTAESGSGTRVALVTGGASGIGLACARAFLDDGMHVVIADRAADAIVAALVELGDAATGFVVDVRDEATVEQMVTSTIERLGRLDVAVNAAGTGTHALVVDLELDQWNTVVDICLTGVFLSTKHEARAMRAQGLGVIINIASINAFVPADGMTAYCAAKAGVAMFTKTAALELAEHGVRVVGIAPGYVETPLTSFAKQIPGIHEAYVDSIPLGRAGQPEDIASLVVFLASERASWITGTTVTIDGAESTQSYPIFRRLLSPLAAD